MPKSTLFNAFERILKRAGLPKLPIRSLRHTHAVLLLEAGADMKFIQERLGYGSMQITTDIYSHVSKKADKKNTARFDNMDSILK
jgi:integrase